MARWQRGTLRDEPRKDGQTWVLRYYVTREDGKRVEHTTPIGLLTQFPSESSAWKEVDRLHLHESINKPDFKGTRITFGMLAQSYIENELGDQSDSEDPKSHTTCVNFKQNLYNRILPRWGKSIAAAIEPLEVKAWLRELKQSGLANATLSRQRRIMSLVFKHAQLNGIISRDEGANPLKLVRCKTGSDYQPKVITPHQAWAIWNRLQEPESTFVLLVAATGLRISEALGLKWSDLDYLEEQIHVRRGWCAGQVSFCKSKASRAAVPMNKVLAAHLQIWRDQSLYAGDDDWIFASVQNKGRTPRCGGMLTSDYIKRTAITLGILKEGEKGGAHLLRHALCTFLISQGQDPKTVQGMLRHSHVTTTLQLYAHGRSEDRLAAQGTMLDAFFAPAARVQ